MNKTFGCLSKTTFCLLAYVGLSGCGSSEPVPGKPFFAENMGASIVVTAPQYAVAGTTIELTVKICNSKLAGQSMVPGNQSLSLTGATGCEFVSFGGHPVQKQKDVLMGYEVSNPDFVLDAQGQFESKLVVRLGDYNSFLPGITLPDGKLGCGLEIIYGSWVRCEAFFEVRKR